MDEQDSEFTSQFEGLHTCKISHPILYFRLVDVLIKLRDSNDPKFKVDFHVDFS
jgi:hypothetical protein